MAAIANVGVVAVSVLPQPPLPISAFSFKHSNIQSQRLYPSCSKPNQRIRPFPSSLSSPLTRKGSCFVLSCLPQDSESSSSSSNTRKPGSGSDAPSTKLFVSG